MLVLSVAELLSSPSLQHLGKARSYADCHSKGTIEVNEQACQPECIYALQPALDCSAHSHTEFSRSAMPDHSMTPCVY